MARKSSASVKPGPAAPATAVKGTPDAVKVVPAPSKTSGASEGEIRLRAYEKWVAAGKPEGDGVNFWMKAELELRQAK